MNNKDIRKSLILTVLVTYLIIGVIGLILVIPYAQESISKYFFYNSVEALKLVLVFTIMIVVIIPTLLFSYFLIKSNKDKNVQKDNSMIRISEERDNIERQLYELNERLSATESRWKEANKLILESQDSIKNNTSGVISTDKFLESFGVKPNSITIDRREVFVLTPFNKMYSETYEVIKKACAHVKLRAERSDDEFVQYNIMKHIIERMVSARIIIANVNGRNANVMYELGIAHALNKPTIIIDQGNQLVPFDINGKNVIIYDNYEELENELVEQLKSILVLG